MKGIDWVTKLHFSFLIFYSTCILQVEADMEEEDSYPADSDNVMQDTAGYQGDVQQDNVMQQEGGDQYEDDVVIVGKYLYT